MMSRPVPSRAPASSGLSPRPGMRPCVRTFGIWLTACAMGLGGIDDMAGAQTSFNVSLVSHLPLNPPPIADRNAADISAQGNLVFVSRWESGVTIIDVSDVMAPFVRASWVHPTAPMEVLDARPLGNTLWLANQRSGTAISLIGLDISNPDGPTSVAGVGQTQGFPTRIHNLFPSGSHLYLSGFGAAGGNYIVNASSPASPQVETVIATGIHDNSVVDDTLYIAGGYDGLFVYDVATPASPVLVSSFNPSTDDTLFYCHNAWPIRHTGYVVVGEEIQVDLNGGVESHQGSLRIVDIRDPGNPQQVWRWRSENAHVDPVITVHNAYVFGDFLYLSHYQDGLKIFDVSDPATPVEVAFYDTYPDTPTALFEGCFGVDATQGNDRIFLSDRVYGFFHVAFNGARKSSVSGRVLDSITLAPIAGATVRSATAGRTVTASGAGEYALATGSGVHQFQASAPGYTLLIQPLALGDLGTLTHDFLLTPLSVGAGQPAGPVPADLVLGPAVPNPLHTATTLGYEIPASADGARIELAIFDVTGSLVARWVEGPARPGRGEVTWDGRDHAGRPVAPGIYYARLTSGGETRTRKLTVSR